MTRNGAIHQPSVLLRSLDSAIAKKNLLKHPFYRDWQKGILRRRSLQIYASQYYRHVEAFPDCLLALAMRSESELRDIVLENLAEEINPKRPHPQLWRDFAAAVGLSNENLADSAPMPATKALVLLVRQICDKRPAAEAVAALYAYEAQVPEIAEKKIKGLRKFYGVTDEKGLAYFAVHLEADKTHRAAWRAWLEENAQSGLADSAATLAAANDVLDALWNLLDCVHGAHRDTTGIAV
jgi:pyrroloquinoline-quinone synthase